jgi:cell fate regulator YaaT (PSP1 superfamily)
MYLGLTKAPNYYKDLMNTDFMEYLDKFIIVFIDGILVYSKSEEEYEEHLRLVSQKIQDPRLYVKISKCEFWMKQVSFLSYIIVGRRNIRGFK